MIESNNASALYPQIVFDESISSNEITDSLGHARTSEVGTDDSTNTTDSANAILITEQVEGELKEEKLLEAARLLRSVQNAEELGKQFHRILHKADIFDEAVSDLLTAPNAEDGWHAQGQTHGSFDSSIYYKLESGAKMTCRMETPVPASLLVPLLSVLNESSLYRTWIPYWKTPVRIGVRESKKLIQDSRGHQIIQVKCDVPWPFAPRDIIIDAQAVDDIDAQGFIAIKMNSLDDKTPKEELPESFQVPPLAKNADRVDFNGAILFRACPTDHPNYAAARKQVPPEEELVLIQFKVYFNAHIAMLPKSVINFITRTVIGTIWSTFLQVALEVRDGTRPDDVHQQAIESKPEFYGWVRERSNIMLNGLKDGNKNTKTTTKEDNDEAAESQWNMTDVLKIAT